MPPKKIEFRDKAREMTLHRQEAKDFLGALKDDANFIHNMVSHEQLESNEDVLQVVDFLDHRTQFWKNEDPLKGRKRRQGIVEERKKRYI